MDLLGGKKSHIIIIKIKIIKIPGWSNVLNLASAFVALSFDFNAERQGKEIY